MEHLAVDVRSLLLFQLLADVGRHGINVGLQHLHVLEDGMVDALQHVVGLIRFLGCHFIGVVDQTGT